MIEKITALLLLGAAAAPSPAAASSVVVGEPAPDFAVATADGGRMKIGDLRGKRVLVFMWASW